MKAVFVLLVGLILASAVVAGPLFGSWQSVDQVEECSDLTRFVAGNSYTFSYEAVTNTGIKGAGPESTMTMTCNIKIEAPERCRHVLKTTSCQLDESPEFALEMSAHDLVFRTDRGRIIEVLAHPDEPVPILNAKRGMLSLLQLDVKADDVDRTTINEVSVHGNCSSEMTVMKRDNKNRPRRLDMITDLNACVLRKRPAMTMWQSFNDILFNTTIVDKFINSTKMCTYDLKGTSGEFKSVVCTEIHSFWPMNFNSESGVRTSIEQTLTNTNVERLNSIKINPANTRSTCLRYEHDPVEIGRKAADITADQAIDILKALVKGSREEVRMETPRLFGRWRAALEGMNNATIHEVFDRAYNCSEYSQTCRDNPDKPKLAREYLLDGLLPCTTMACFSVKNYAIAKGVVPKPLANAWMVSMALQNYPSLELMSEMLRMAQTRPSQITIFPLSIMIHNYWMNNEEIHTSDSLPEPITNTVRYLKSLIGSDCNVHVENERLALIALKAIGNIGQPVERFDLLTSSSSDKVSPALLSCSKNKQIPTDISKAAIQSMRRFVLSDQLRPQVIDELVKETSLEVSQRIAAYLIAMKGNPTVSELNGIWASLKTEPVKQMKAFCYSHIQNILESSEPTLQVLVRNLHQAIDDEQLPEYPKDIRKYSRYFELSTNVTEPWRNNTLALQFESDIIYKPESYMPHEVMFHYVMNALGKSWDLFETGVEMKGFEPILESVFGPEGFFPEISLQTLFENIDEKFLTKVREFAEVQLENWVSPEPEQPSKPIFNKKNKYSKKVKRQASMDNQQIVDIIHQTTLDKLNNLHNLVGMESSAPDVTIYLRLLGNEFGFVSASDVLSVIPYTMGIVEEFVNKTKEIPDLLSRGLNLNTTRSLVFLDKTFIIPTGLGMPLNCSVNGTAVVSLRVKSQFSINLPKIIAAGHVAPSGAVEVLAIMGIGMPTKVFTGVMANSTVYHSSKLAGNITIDGTRLKINLKNTDKPMNLFNYSTTYNLLKADGSVEYIPGVLQDAVKGERCTDVSRVFGVDLCVSWAYPNASYVPDAPRFPFAGPNSFNVTLVNTDKDLKAYTIDAQYKQIKEGGAQNPVSFGSIGKRKKRSILPVTKLVDTVRISFSAPGEELTRNVTSFLSFDRLRKTAQWTFIVPEVNNFTIFTGILNETTNSAHSYRAVFNVSGANNAASVDFLVRDETNVEQKNLTAVFNASINNLYWAAVGQFVKQSTTGNWNAHLTDTYYWDNDTPLHKQILFPWTGYTINHEKYRTSSISAFRRARGQVIDRNMIISTLGWKFNFNTRQTTTDTLQDLAIHAQISNNTWEFPLVDMGLRNVTTDMGYRLEGEISRNTHHAFVEYDVTKQTRQTYRNCRMGLRTDVFVDNPDVAMFMNSPVLLKLFGETALIDEPVVIDGGVNFTIFDQSEYTTEYLVQTSIFVPNPRNPTTHLTYDFDLRVEDATNLNRKNYSLQLSTPIPFLQMSNINNLNLVMDIASATASMEHVYTLYDTRYSKAQTIVSNNLNVAWKKPSANWVLAVETPSLSHYQNYTAVYSRDNGVQYFYESSQDSSFSDLLDFTEINTISVKPLALHTYWSYIHKIASSNISNSLSFDGPITEMRPLLLPSIALDVLKKAIGRNFSDVNDIIMNKLIYNISESSLTLRQSINVTSPIVANMSAIHHFFLSKNLFHHKLSFSAAQIRLNISAGFNHSLVLENRELTMKTEGGLHIRRGLQASTLTSVNATLLESTPRFDLSALHNTQVTSPLMQFSTISLANGNVGERNMLNLVGNHNTVLSAHVGSLNIDGNYNINDMISPTNFEEVNGMLRYKILSHLVKSSFNSSVTLSTFRRLFKFQEIQAKAYHDIKSNILNWNAQGRSLLKHFSRATQFGEINSNLEANLLSKFVKTSHSSALRIRNMSGLVQFDELTGHLRNNVTSQFVNSTYETEMNFNNVESLVSFRRIEGSSNYVLSSRLMNVTANNTLDLSGFRQMFNFDEISGNQIWFLKTRVVNAMMNNDIALTGFRRLTNFDKVTGRVSANFSSCWANGMTHNTLLIQNAESITTVNKVAAQSVSNFTSRPVNISFIDTFVITNHRAFLDFDSITSTMQFASKIVNVSASALNEASFNGVRGLFNFDSVRHSLNISSNSFYLNTSLNEIMALENFRCINEFELISAEITSTFMTFPLMMMYQQSHRIEDMNGWFQYPIAETVIMGNITTGNLNLSSSYEARIVEMHAPFDYDGGLARIQYAVRSGIFEMTGIHKVEVNNMQGIFNFGKINGISSHVLDTPVTHMSIGGLLDLVNFQGLFTFDLVNVTTENIFTITPLTTTFASYNGGLELRGFEKWDTFNIVQGFSRSAVLTKWTNWTTNVESELSGFRSFLIFDHIKVIGQNVFTNPLFVITSNTTNTIVGSSGLFKATNAGSRNIFSMSSCIANINIGGIWSVSNLMGPLLFSNNNINTFFNVSSPLVNAGSAFTVDMINWQNLTHFESFEISAGNDLLSGIVNWNVLSRLRLDNMTGILTYSRMEGSASSNFVNIISSVNTSVNGFINSQSGMFSFDEMVLSARSNVSSWPFDMESSTELSIQNMAGFMTFDTISGSASSNISSRYINTTSQTSLVAHAGTGLFKVDVGNVTASVSVETPITKTIKASSYSHIKKSRSLFNFDEAEIKSEFSIIAAKINVTGNAKSTFSNFANITQFDACDSSSEMIISSRLLNSSSSGILQLKGFQGLFSFAKVNIGGFTAIRSILADVTSKAGIEFANFQRIFYFERINSSAGIELVSTPAKIDVMTGMEMVNFNGPTTFDRFNGSFISNVKSSFLNTTTAAAYSLQGFRSLFKFVKVQASAESVIVNRLLNTSLMADYNITNSSSFCRFSHLIVRSAASFNTKLATGNTVGALEIHNVRNYTSFDLLNVTTAARFNSKLFTALTQADYSIRNQQWLFKFDDVTGRAYGNIQSKWLNGTTMIESQMINSRSLLEFEAAKSQGSFILRSPLTETHLHGNINLIDFTDITHYVESSAIVTANISSPFINTRAYSRVNVSHMAGLMTFDRFLTDSFANIQSRPLNTTLQNSVIIAGVQGLSLSAAAHRFNFLWSDPLNELSVKNGLDMSTLQDMEQLFNVTWINPKGTVFISQSANYENLITSIKVPSIGAITAGASLNPYGDILRFYIDHQLMKNNLKTVNDITWFLRLNESNVIYSNFSWNPDTVNEIVAVAVDAINNTFNRTLTIANSTINRIMEVANRTLTHTRRMTNCTKCFMRYTMTVAKETLNETLLHLNDTLHNQLVQFNHIILSQLTNLNQTFFNQIERLKGNIALVCNNPREFISNYVNLTRVNETIATLNETLVELYTKLHYNVTHPRETVENIKLLVKYEQRLEKMKWLVVHRDEVKTRIIEYLNELRKNMSRRAETAIHQFKSTINYDANVQAVRRYIETRFNVSKIEEKVQEMSQKIDEIKVKMAKLRAKVGERLTALKRKIATLDRESLKAEVMERIDMIKNFIMYYLNRTTLDAIDNSLFIDYEDDTQVQELMRKIIRIRPRNIMDIINTDRIVEANNRIGIMLEVINKTTFRYVNKTFVNNAAIQTLAMLRKWNTSFHELVYVDVIKDDIHLVVNLTKERIASLTTALSNFVKAKTQTAKVFLREIWDARPQSLEEIKERLMEFKIIVAHYIRDGFNIDIDLVAQNMVGEFLKGKEVIDVIIGNVIAISKNETHPLNMLPLCYFDRTIFQIAQPPVTRTIDITTMYGKMALNFTKVYGKEVINFTQVYSRVAVEKGIALTKIYVPIVVRVFNENKDLVIKKYRVMKEDAFHYLQMAKDNATMYYHEYAPIVNETIRNYACLAKETALNYSVRVRDITNRYITMTIEFLEPHVQPYREVIMQKVTMLKTRAAELKQRVRQLPAHTEMYLMTTAEYHIDHYPEYKQKTIEKIDDLKTKLNALKANLTNLYTELKENLTQYYTELQENLKEAYIRYSDKAQQMYVLVNEKFDDFRMRVQRQWLTIRPVIETKTGEIANVTMLKLINVKETVIRAAKDEFSLINELPMRAMDKTIFELTMELNEFTQQLIERTKMNLMNRDSSINMYPVMYLNITLFEAGNYTYDKMVMASNLTRFYINQSRCWAKTSLASMNKTIYDVMILTNETLREIVVPYIDQTTEDIIVFLNRSRYQPWSATLYESINFLNETSVTLMNRANEAFIAVQIKAIDAWKNMTSEESIAKLTMYLNRTQTIFIETVQDANEKISKLKSKSLNFISYLMEETQLLNLTREYAYLAKNFTVNSISQARNISQMTLCLARNVTNSITTYINNPAREITMEYVNYINNTMPGWIIRYYEVDQIPAKVRTCLTAMEPVQLAKNWSAYAIKRTRFMTEMALNHTHALSQYAFDQTRVITQFTLNQTRLLTKQAINRTRTLIRDTLNTIGRLDDHSFAMNISHSFNWTSFRSVPRLSNAQIQFLKEKVSFMNETVVEPLIEKIEELRFNLGEQYRNISRMVMEFYKLKRPIVQEKIEEIRMRIEEKMNEYKEQLIKFKNLLRERWLKEWKPTLLEKREEMMNKWENEIKPNMTRLAIELMAFVNDPELVTKVKENVQYLMNTSPCEMKRLLVEEKYPEFKRILLNEKYPEMKRQILAQYEVAKAVLEGLKNMTTHFRTRIEERIQNLAFEAEVKWTELKEKIQEWKDNWPQTYRKLKADILDFKMQLRTKFSQYIHQLLTVLRHLRIPFEVLPLEHIDFYTPWKYTAMIFGKNHLMTFDGKVYSVPHYSNEQQTYVLAHDFIDRNFTLLSQKKRITLLVSNMSVTIDDQNAVFIDGRPTLRELPYQTPFSKEFTIMRKGPWVNVTTTKGIALSCHQDHFLCIFHLSGWYHGRTRGLLGNLDTEHHNEFILPEGDITTDLTQFISAYDVSPLDSPRYVTPSQFGTCLSLHEKCRAMFLDNNSILNETFNIINQIEFFDFCVEQTRMCLPSCNATNPVVTLGKELGVQVNYDSECLDCNVGDMNQVESRSSSSADIVFVISETLVMAEDNMIKASLNNVIRNINMNLDAFIMTEVRYGLAAFGGSNIHAKPHSHTLCGQLMNDDINCAVRGVESLVFQGENPTDAMQAIQLAAHYPFRQEAAKIIILITDEELNEESGKPWDYLFNINTSLPAMQQLLDRQGITFNVFSSYPTLNKKTAESPILGVNYLGKQIIKKKNSGEEGIDRLAIPKGQYAKLAKATRGSIMGLHWLRSDHRDMTFMFPKVIRKQIQPQFSGQVDYNCRCVLGVYGEARTECQMSRFADGEF